MWSGERMTKTNHSQSIPVSPNVFPTKNKKMTEQAKELYGETVMDIRSKVNEQIDIAMEIYRKDGPVWHILVVEKMIENSEDYDADVIEYIKELLKKVKKDVESIHYNLGLKTERTLTQIDLSNKRISHKKQEND